MNPFEAAEAVSHPEIYIPKSFDAEGTEIQDTSLSSGGSPVVNPLTELNKLLGSNNLVNPSQFTPTNIFDNNPYTGGGAPVADRPLANYNPPTSQPFYNPNTGTSRTLPDTGFGGGDPRNAVATPYSDGGSSNFNDIWNQSGGNNFSVGSGTAGMFDSAGTNINNFLSDTFGSSYNPNFGTTATTGQGSVNWGTKNRAFNFGNTPIFGDGLQTPGWTKDALGFARAAGYDTSDIKQGLNLANLTGNKLFDMGASYSGNPYLGMLNNDFSQRGIMNKALSFSKVPYAGGLMGLMDYGQGYNNYGALGSTIGGALLGPLGAWAGSMLGRNATGFDDQGNFTNYINDNYSGAGRDYAEASGFKVGTPEFDYAIKGFEHMQRSGKNTQGQQELVDKWNTKYTTRKEAEQAAAQAAWEEKNKAWGKQGDDAWSPGGGDIFRGAGANWNTPGTKPVDTAPTVPGTGYTGDFGLTNAPDDLDLYDNPSESAGAGTTTAGGYSWDSDLGTVAEMQEETGIGTSEWDSSSDDFGGWGSTAEGDAEGGFSQEDSDFANSGFDDDSGGDGDSGGGGGSYIATAATQALGKEGLTIFEDWRDYMFTKLPTFTTSYGRYRVTAPKIVSVIDTKDNSKGIYNYIWDMHLKPIFDLIQEDRDSTKALKDYKKMVRELQNKFLKEKA